MHFSYLKVKGSVKKKMKLKCVCVFAFTLVSFVALVQSEPFLKMKAVLT